MTQYLPPLRRTLTVTHVEGCPANVPEEEDTLMPRSLETIPSLASASAPSATVGLKMSSSPSSGFEPLTERHCLELFDDVVVVDAPEFPELPVDVEKFDLGGDWAIVTVVFCPSLTEVYWARYVRFFERFSLFVSAMRLSGETARPDAGSAGTRTRARGPRRRSWPRRGFACQNGSPHPSTGGASANLQRKTAPGASVG